MTILLIFEKIFLKIKNLIYILEAHVNWTHESLS